MKNEDNQDRVGSGERDRRVAIDRLWSWLGDPRPASASARCS